MALHDRAGRARHRMLRGRASQHVVRPTCRKAERGATNVPGSARAVAPRTKIAAGIWLRLRRGRRGLRDVLHRLPARHPPSCAAKQTAWLFETLYLRSPPKDKRNLPANTQHQTPRPHLTATIRPVMPETQRRSRQMRHRKMCKPQRDSGSSCTTPMVSRAGLDRRTRNRGRNRQQHNRDKHSMMHSMMTW